MRCEFPCHLHFGLSYSHGHTHMHKQTNTLPLLVALSLSLSCFTSKVSPPRCRATRTIIIKTKMFKIHFLCFFTHRISAVLVCHLSCASSLSTSYIHTHTHTNTYASVNVQNSCLAYSCTAHTGPAQWRQNKILVG